MTKLFGLVVIAGGWDGGGSVELFPTWEELEREVVKLKEAWSKRPTTFKEDNYYVFEKLVATDDTDLVRWAKDKFNDGKDLDLVTFKDSEPEPAAEVGQQLFQPDE